MVRAIWLAALAFAMGLSALSYAGEVTKVAGKKVLLSVAGDDAHEGDMFYLLKDGKKVAIVKITKVSGDKAVGLVLKSKGDVAAGMTTQKRDASSAKQAASSGGGISTTGASKKSYWGGVLGYSQDTMNVSLPSGASVSMAGSAFSALGLFDYKFFNRGWFRGEAGYQGFSTSSGATYCPGGVACNMSASYLDFTFMFRYLFTDSSFRPWLGGGFGLMFPITKSSTALDTGSISPTGIFIVTGGADWQISPSMYIPISIEYGLFPKSSTVDASWITIRVGAAVPF